MRSDSATCPIITIEQYQRAILILPSRQECNDTTRSDTFSVFLDGNEDTFVMFDWSEEGNGWRLRNKLVAKPNIAPMYECPTCKAKGGAHVKSIHVINKTVTKKKCLVCETVTNL
jgi:hypothetical protein